MSKRKDLESLRERLGMIMIPFSVAGPAWELGRIAGIREAAKRTSRSGRLTLDGPAGRPLRLMAAFLSAHAHKLERRLKV